MANRTSTAAILCLGLGALALSTPTEAQTVRQVDRARRTPVYELVPRSACLRLSTMQIGSNAQKGMRSGAQNHNSSRSNRTQPMPRPDVVTDDADGDGFPDMLGSARIRISDPAIRGRRGDVSGRATVQLEIGDPDTDDDAISGLVDATTFRVTRQAPGVSDNPLHEEASTTAQNPLFERAGATSNGPTRIWSYALVQAMGDPDSDEDANGNALAGATLHVFEAGGRFHVELEVPASEAGSDTATGLDAATFSISRRSARTGR